MRFSIHSHITKRRRESRSRKS